MRFIKYLVDIIDFIKLKGNNISWHTRGFGIG